MMGATDISWMSLILGSMIMIIPIWIFAYYKTGLVKATILSFSRMSLQLILVGVYLKYIFDLNSIYINLGWVLIMVIAASFTVIKRSELSQRLFYIPVILGIIVNILINGTIVAFILIGSDEFFNARYIIPIMGMFIGNSLTSSIIGLRSFYQNLVKDEDRLKYYLACGASEKEAISPFIRDALKEAFNPSIASTATIGLIWLPGMMTGQILGGSDPITSIKYQIMIIIGIFVGGVISTFINLSLSRKYALDGYGMINRKIFRNN